MSPTGSLIGVVSRARRCCYRRLDLGDVWTLVTGADAHLEGFSWLYAADPALGQHASVKESITRPIGQLEETKSLFKAEPFNSSADWRSGRCLEPSLAEARSRSKCAGLSGVGVSVELRRRELRKS